MSIHYFIPKTKYVIYIYYSYGSVLCTVLIKKRFKIYFWGTKIGGWGRLGGKTGEMLEERQQAAVTVQVGSKWLVQGGGCGFERSWA